MKARKLLAASALLLTTSVGQATFTPDNCFTNSQYGSALHFNAQYFNAGCAAPSSSSSGKRTKGVTLPGVSMN